jgi:hypothetical protein
MIERALMAVESKKREIQNEVLRVRQVQLETDATIQKLQDPRAAEVIKDLNEVEAEVDLLTTKIKTAEGLVREAENEEVLSDGSSLEREIQVSYSILRERDGDLREEPASETTPLNPGDIVRVTRSFERPPKAGGLAARVSN